MSGPHEAAEPRVWFPEHTVLVWFHEGAEPQLETDGSLDLARLCPEPERVALPRAAPGTYEPVFDGPIRALAEAVDAETAKGPAPTRLTSFHQLHLPPTVAVANVLEQLRHTPAVAAAAPELGTGEPPCATSPTDPTEAFVPCGKLVEDQGYLWPPEAVPNGNVTGSEHRIRWGVDAIAAGAAPGGQGQGTHLVLLERGFPLQTLTGSGQAVHVLDREGLPTSAELVLGTSLDKEQEHAAGDLGVMVSSGSAGTHTTHGVAAQTSRVDLVPAWLDGSQWQTDPSIPSVNGTAVAAPAPQRDNTATFSSKVSAVGPAKATKVRRWSLLLACARLARGSILLVEDQWVAKVKDPANLNTYTEHYVPMEADLVSAQIFRWATQTREGVVVQPAGNGALDLDGLSVQRPDPSVSGSYDPNDPHFLDPKKKVDRTLSVVRASASTHCGAWLVAAVDPEDQEATTSTNYGGTVDFFAWGHHVTTYDGTSDNSWVSGYGGTSAAAAIVAGAALAAQGMYLAAKGVAAGPDELHSLLRNSLPVTPALGPKAVGVMPNLRSVGHALDAFPELFIRDHLQDDGSPRPAGTLSQSPDILVLPGLHDPTALTPVFVQGAGRMREATRPLSPHADLFVYVRASNAGTVEATEGLGRVWWSLPNTLNHPMLWGANLVGQVRLGPIPAASHVAGMAISHGIPWPLSERPAVSTVCLVAALGHAGAPPVTPGELATTGPFFQAVAELPSLAWRNVVLLPGLLRPPRTTPTPILPRPALAPLDFLVAGGLGEDMPFELRLNADLPAGAQLELLVPPDLRDRLEVEAGAEEGEGEDVTGLLGPVRAGKSGERWSGRAHVLRISPEGATLQLSATADRAWPARLRLLPPPEAEEVAAEVHLEQWWEGIRAGGLTVRWGEVYTMS